jgi:hypothetical protein
MELEPITKPAEQIELENELPEMQEILKYLRTTKPTDDEELEEYDNKLIHLIGWTDRAFMFDTENKTEVEKLLDNPKDLKHEFDIFHKKIRSLDIER